MRRAILTLGFALVASAAAAQSAPSPGEAVFRSQCMACHRIGPNAANGVGPQLNGVFGRRAGSLPNFNYSQAYRSPPTSEKTWDEENFRVYIRNPREVTPGTRMVYAGLRNEEQITQLIAYLKSFDANGAPRQ